MPAPSNAAPDFVSPKLAAKLLAVDKTSIYRWVAAGRLRAFRVGNARFRLRRADVMNMLRPVHPGDDTTDVAACEPVQPVRPIPPPVVRPEPVAVKSPPVPPPEAKPAPLMLSADEVAARLQISSRTLWRMVQQGKAPQPIRYNRKLVRWKVADVEEWVRRQEGRPAA